MSSVAPCTEISRAFSPPLPPNPNCHCLEVSAVEEVKQWQNSVSIPNLVGGPGYHNWKLCRDLAGAKRLHSSYPSVSFA